MNEYQIKFMASGYVSQTIQIFDETITQEELIKGLQSGKYLTTVGSTGNILETTNWTTVGEVLCTDEPENMEYSDFGNE